ncbi:MAG: RNA methyltransferase [bacterium]|nr:RNA methyltransferase [bacterium]
MNKGTVNDTPPKGGPPPKGEPPPEGGPPPEAPETPAPILLEGLLSVDAALKARSRPVSAVIVRENSRDYEIGKLIKTAEAAAIPVYRTPEAEIDALAQGNTHGGVIAFAGERRTLPLERLLYGIDRPLIVMLDGVEDPFNYGQSIRAFYAAGAHGLVVRPRAWTGRAEGIVARASAAASEWMPTAQAESVEAAADVFRAHGLKIAAADKHRRAVSVFEADLAVPLFLVIGGEKRGITRSFADSADVRVTIPYGRDFEASLGTTAAASVLAFELLRQRMARQVR